ncbi:MAG TPA: hypothetical protein VIU64_08885, partial [Polyangia bacterium]
MPLVPRPADPGRLRALPPARRLMGGEGRRAPLAGGGVLGVLLAGALILPLASGAGCGSSPSGGGSGGGSATGGAASGGHGSGGSGSGGMAQGSGGSPAG